MSSLRSTCPYCGVGCGVVAAQASGTWTVSGDPAHPANAGRLCSKGSALGETVNLDKRLLRPKVGGQVVSWEHAIATVADGFLETIERHGPESVAFYVSGQLLTEDYYLANKLMKGYMGSANIDTNSRLCMSSAVAGYKRAFGGDLVPNSYRDLEQADLIVLSGSNTAWCHPIVYQRIAAARRKRPNVRVVVIDPRRTATCEIADLHLPLSPGTDVALFNGLLRHLDLHGAGDADFIAQSTSGLESTLKDATADAPNVAAVASICGLREQDVQAFYDWFTAKQKTVTLFSQGVNQSSQGTDKVNAIINCHLLTGRVGKPGSGPFSITGQPNAMGGREVGGLATTLAAHMDIDRAEHRDTLQRFWFSPAMAQRPGLKAVDLFDAVLDGKVKAIWIMATNPVVSLPDADRVRQALQVCDLVVVSDVQARTDTSRLAHVQLPALAWGEKDGTVTNSERRISRQRAFLPVPGEARPDWWIIKEVAREMGYDGFDYQSPHEIFDEHARLSAFENNGSRGFDIGGLSGLGRKAYDELAPIQWPVPKPRARSEASPLFADGKFFTADQRAHFVPVRTRKPGLATNHEFPLILNTGRIRDQWHTMTRSGRSPTLATHLAEPYAQINARDGLAYGIKDGALVRVRSRSGAVVVRAHFSTDIARGQIFVPIHWNGDTASDARIGALVNAAVDPVSGEPEFKHTPTCVEPFDVDWHGFVLSTQPIDLDTQAWWVRVTGKRFERYELAGRGAVSDWSQWGRSLLGLQDDDEVLEYADAASGSYRVARVVDGRIDACAFASRLPDLPSRAWLSSLFIKDELSLQDRIGLLAGKPADPSADVGPTVCVCFGVGRNTIERAIRNQSLEDVESIGRCLKAGTNCGSCVPELAQLLRQQHEVPA